MDFTKKGVRYIILLAPLIFICHFLEEAHGFVAWFNLHVSRDISSRLFWSVNVSALAITLFVILIELTAPSRFSVLLTVLWLSFLMLANAVFHIAGGIMDKGYVPGLITAIILYIPYYSLIIVKTVKTGRVGKYLITGSAVLGALPMLVHGYKILFLGGRLF